MASFEPGENGNHDMRKLDAAARRRAREEAGRCVTTLAAVRDDATAPPATRVEAASTLLAIARLLPASASERAA